MIDGRLTEIDDCLYRCAVRVVVAKDHKIFLVKDLDSGLWVTPGGGIDYGEMVEASLIRELAEELGLEPSDYKIYPEILFVSAGAVHNLVPRLNIYYAAQIDESKIKFGGGDEITEIDWFNREQLAQMGQQLHPMLAYDLNRILEYV